MLDRFSTGPHDKYTHWKQTVFYLDKDLIVNEGDVVTGTIRVSRNQHNPRDLDILLRTSHDGASHQGKVVQQRLYTLR